MSRLQDRRILVVGESAEERASLSAMLRNHPASYTVEEAASGAAGLARVRELPPDCLLLDFHLPDMDARSFLEALHGPGHAAEGQAVPVALLADQDSDEAARDALERGAQDYLIKGAVNGPVLARAIENAISKFRIQREMEEQRRALELRNRKLELVREELQARLGELAEAQASRDRFLAVMSHEMRTPLNAILGYTDLLDMGLEGTLTPGQREHIERIRVGGRHLLDLINDVLDLARADARRLDLDIRPVDLHAVLEEVLALLGSQAEKKGISLHLHAEQAPTHVQADLQRLRQVMVNLVGNAIKFTNEGAVTVRYAEGPHGRVLVQVQDTGIGIPADTMPLIFEEFFQGNDELTREQGGSGLGLAISQRLARLMGGDISAESRAGDGSVFTVALRRPEQGARLREEDVEGQQARRDARTPPERAASDAASQREAVPPAEQVSVVAFGEDAETLAELERHVHPGVRLRWTTDAADVPALAMEERAALVVLDVSSADGDAWRAASAVQAAEGLAETAVLLLPAIPAVTAEAGAEGLDLGWVSLVPKPFSPAQLTRAVSSALHRGEGSTEDERIDAISALVIDDDEDSRRVAVRILQEADVRVQEAADGESALTKMRNHPPDVVVLDLMMPVLDGFGVLATMRADPLLAGVPVVVLTAKSLTEAERQFLGRTAARVLQKGEHRLADVAALVLRAAAGAPARL